MNTIITRTAAFVKEQLADAEAGHDWFHIERVWKLARKIQQTEGGNLEIIELAALLHDIADPKFHNGDEQLALNISNDFMTSQNVDPETAAAVLDIIKNISFKNRGEQQKAPSLELKIVQDADRLDAIGAIGIARTFHFGGFRNNPLYDPEVKPNFQQTKEEYKKSQGTTVNHFYEKLLLLKDLMNTQSAKKLAERRHAFMLSFLEEFYQEWHEPGN